MSESLRLTEDYLYVLVSPEARSMALEILPQAEAERAALAQAEAEHGINWEEEPKGDE